MFLIVSFFCGINRKFALSSSRSCRQSWARLNHARIKRDPSPRINPRPTPISPIYSFMHFGFPLRMTVLRRFLNYPLELGTDTKTDTKRVKFGSSGVVTDYAWFPLRNGHFDPANATRIGQFRPAPPPFPNGKGCHGEVPQSGTKPGSPLTSGPRAQWERVPRRSPVPQRGTETKPGPTGQATARSGLHHAKEERGASCLLVAAK